MNIRSLLGLAGALSLAACVQPGARSSRTPPPAPAPSAGAPTEAVAGPNPTVGGAAMLETRAIAQNAAAAPNLSTLVSALRAAGLDATLSGPGPFTVFAPTDDAFAGLAPGTLDRLLRPENRATLATVLNHHVVPGRITAAELRRRIAAGGGSAQLTTVAGQTLTARLDEGFVTLTDANGTRAYVETADVRQSNGVVHVVNGVLAPRLG